jgi:hypothetical protein
MDKPLLVATRGGIGDHLISSGIINVLSETRKIYLVCWKLWEESLAWLYQDNSNVELYPHQDKYLGPFHERDMNKFAAKFEADYLGITTTTVDLKTYYTDPYTQMKMPPEYMYTKFKLPKNPNYDLEFIENNKPKNPYVLLNIWDKLGNGNIPNFQSEHVDPNLEQVYITPKKTNNLFNWIPIIEGASEIHSVPGGPCHIIDFIYNGKMYYHDARAGTIYSLNNNYNNHKWTVIKYKVKKAQ